MSGNNSPRYVVITPARNEAEFLPETVRSMLSQTLRPAQWVIVNDGSTDATGTIAAQAAAAHPDWISVLDTEPGALHSRGSRAIEAKEIQAFHKGLATLRAQDWDFIVKLDADVGFGPDYFERCLQHFAADPQLGMGGGRILNKDGDRFVEESHPAFHVRGATKIYRRACWDAIGGISSGAGWDTVDEVTANLRGWKTRTFPDVEIIHYRWTGAANGSWKNGVKNGMWSYIAGYHPLFFLLRCGKQCLRPPSYAAGAVALLAGYTKGWLHRVDRAAPEVVRYTGRQQVNRMLGRPTIWR